MKIFFENLKIFAFHGLYPEEQKLGTYFLVSLELSMPDKFVYETLSDTLNYVEIYNILKALMLTPYPLLETLAEDIIKTLKKTYPVLREMTIKIEKLNPPIPHFTGRVGVMVSRKF